MNGMINNSALLSICIPIYNRESYLKKMLSRFTEDRELFQEKIELIISDNHSSDDLKSVVDSFVKKGLQLYYYKQEQNIGADRNFLFCFGKATGKYCWLLGSDDIPQKGVLVRLLSILESDEYGLVHLSMIKRDSEITLYKTSNEMVVAVNYWITFMSSNIIRTMAINLNRLNCFKSTHLIQVPAYLDACFYTNQNVILYYEHLFEENDNFKNNGGYNLFKVFVENLFGIYQFYIENGLLSQQCYEKIKKETYKNFLAGYIVNLLILPNNKSHNFDLTNAWNIIKKHYGKYFYAYMYILKKLLSIPMHNTYKKLIQIAQSK